jgi:transcriptional regulator with XRE-family HTH domain
VDFWDKARRLREERGLSQAAVARRMGTSQSWVARMESGAVDAGLRSVRRYLDAIGARLDVQPDLETELAFRPMTLADVARAARRHIGDGETVLRLCLQFIDDYREADPASQAALLDGTPPSTGDVRWDAFLAALAEHLAYHGGLPIPRWVDGGGRFLEQWWFPTDLPSVVASALAESPAAFRRRGIFVTEDLFARA